MADSKEYASEHELLAFNLQKTQNNTTGLVSRKVVASRNHELDIGGAMQNSEKNQNSYQIKDVFNAMQADDAGSMKTMQENKATALQALENNNIANGQQESKSSSSGFSLKGLDDALAKFKLSKWFGNKNAKVAILIVVLAVVLVMFLSGGLLSSTPGNVGNQTGGSHGSVNFVSSQAYIRTLEERLMNVLSNIRGAGAVTVMVTLETGPELRIATSVDERTTTSTTSSGSTTTVTLVENPIIINSGGQSGPLVLMEIMPVLRGVVIVAAGASSPQVRLELLEAAQTLLNVPIANIQIYASI